MNIKLKVAWISALKNKAIVADHTWSAPDQWRTLDLEQLDSDDLDTLTVILEENKSVKGAPASRQKLIVYRKLLQDVQASNILQLELLAVAFKKLIEPTEHQWLFSENADGHLVPWRMQSVSYHKSEELGDSLAHVKLGLSAVRHGCVVRDFPYFQLDDLGGTAHEILRKKGYYIETPEMIAHYAEENAYYKTVCTSTGEQFLAAGLALACADNKLLQMEQDGKLAKVVMDDVAEEGQEIKYRSSDISESRSLLPVQAYVKVFDLYRHGFASVHTSNLTRYVYDSSLIDKLVLTPAKKDLIAMLIEGADVNMEDIVKGKSGGIIVICTGVPGTGKSLSSEVFSEQVRRPLYSVQCSQLGVDEVALEKTLLTVLGRAQRWGAVLLIDEADVYVHERGNDIKQNAIVGVFLRLLERYNGVLFMTSNRETVIDDAIMSRATAWIRYEIPDRNSAVEIWKVLSAQYRAGLCDDDIATLADRFNGVSGRSIKNLLKLATLYAARKQAPVSVNSVEYVSQFLPLESVK